MVNWFKLLIYLTPLIFCITLSPFIPLPLYKGKGGGPLLREALPLLNSPFIYPYLQEREEKESIQEVSSLHTFPEISITPPQKALSNLHILP